VVATEAEASEVWSKSCNKTVSIASAELRLRRVTSREIIRVGYSRYPHVPAPVYFDIPAVISALIVLRTPKVGRPNIPMMPTAKRSETVVGKSPGLLPALIRYVEAKCLVGGVTTSQGIALFSNAGIRRFYRGIVRNVEETDDESLPEVETRIADVEAQSAQKFLARLKRETCFLLDVLRTRPYAAGPERKRRSR
jgi:hypothetical protein